MIIKNNGDKMIFNFMEETSEIETVSRLTGGWLKNVSGLDKSVTNGYSIEGTFIKSGNYKENYKPGLYLDCSKDGSRWNYHLFRVDEEGFHLLQTVEDGGRNWAVEFWRKIEDELNNNEITATDVVNSLYEKYNEGLISEVSDILSKKEQKNYNINGCSCSKRELEAYFMLSNINYDKLEAKNIEETYKGLYADDEDADDFEDYIDDIMIMLSILKVKDLIICDDIKDIAIKENYETKLSDNGYYQCIVSDELKKDIRRARGWLTSYLPNFYLGNYVMINNKIVLYNINYDDNALYLFYIK